MRILSFHTVAGLLIIGISVAIYANSINVPFVFDDSQNVAFNEHIQLQDLSWDGIYAAAFRSPSPSRPVANLSFALNYYFSDDGFLRGIHVVNILIHVANGLLVYFLCLTWLSFASGKSEQDTELATLVARHRAVALVSALLFVVHPVQTQSVTYVVQRMTSLSVMFYLIALMLYFAGRVRWGRPKCYLWWTASLVAWGLALGCKQIAITFPLVVILSEWLLVSKSKIAPRVDYRRWFWFFVPVIVGVTIAFVLFCFLLGWNPIEELTSHFSKREFTTVERLWTQARVVVFYLSLLFFPYPSRLNLLHDIFPPINELVVLGTLASVLILVVILGWGAYFSRRQPLLAFCIFWFFIQLLIESTVIPLEMVFEHRLYLPAVGVFLFMAAIGDLIGGCWRSRYFGAVTIVLLLLACGTVTRNAVWRDVIGLWTDVISKSPNEPRSWNNRGKAYMALGAFEEARRDYETAMERSEKFVEALNNLGNLFVELEKKQTAIDYLTQVVNMRPKTSVFRYNRAVAYEHFEEYDLAIRDYDTAVELNEKFVTAYFNRGVVYGKMGQSKRAIEDFGRVLAQRPEDAAAYMNRGDAYMQLNRVKLALRDFNHVIQFEPDMAQAYYNRAGAYYRLARPDLALRDYGQAIELGQLDLAYYNRANIFMSEGKLDRAIDDFTTIIQLNPKHIASYNNRGLCYMQLRDFPRANADFEKAIEQDPTSAIPYVSRGNVYAMTGKHAAAIRDYNQALELNSKLPQGYFNRGISRAALSNHLGAVRDFDKAIQLAPKDPENYHRRAYSLFALRRYVEAKQNVRQCQQLGGKPNSELVKQLNQMLKRSN